MSFLRDKDYQYIINSTDLNVITGSDSTFIRNAELAAKAELESYLRPRYDVNLIFKDILAYSDSTTFYTDDLVEWSETAYAAGTTYALDDRVSSGGLIYKSLQNSNTGNAVTESAWWESIGVNESLHYARQSTIGITPDNIFTYTSNAYTDKHDLIKGWDRSSVTLYFKKYDDNSIKIYSSEADRTAEYPTIGVAIYPESGLDTPVIIDICHGDSDILSGQFEIHGFIPDNTEWSVSSSNNWSSGDNRDQQMLLYMIDITLYHLHSRINPRNIPEFRIARRDDAINWLKMIAKGTIQANLPNHVDESKGQNITYNSGVKFSNGNY